MIDLLGVNEYKQGEFIDHNFFPDLAPDSASVMSEFSDEVRNQLASPYFKDELFKKAEETAKRHGIPRSQLFAKALQEFIQSLENKTTTETLNQIYKEETRTGKHASDLSIDSLRKNLKDDAW